MTSPYARDDFRIIKISHEEYDRIKQMSVPELEAEMKRLGADVLELEDDPQFRIVG